MPVAKRRGPKPGIRKDSPVQPRVIKKILHLRNDKEMSFREISEALKPKITMTHMGVWTLYNRWKHWSP